VTAEVLDAGAGWFERSEPVGIVRACFTRAAHVAFGSGLVVIGDPSIPSGPIHLRLRRLPRLVVGQRIEVRVDPDLRWEPRPVDAAELSASRAVGPSVLGGVRSPFGAELTSDVVAMAGTGDLEGVALRVGGRGPGLTPAGDDVLAGILLADAVGRDRWGIRRRRDVAATVATTGISRAFLAWAARGQSIEPVHRLLDALARGDSGAGRRALRSLGEIGASSGLDLAFGLAVGLGVGRATPAAQRDGSTLVTATSGPSARVFDT
jgi:hypothetical protein